YVLDSLRDAVSIAAVRSTVSNNLIDRPTLTTTPGSGLQLGGTLTAGENQELTIIGNYIARQGMGIQWDVGSTSPATINYVTIAGNVIERCLSNAISCIWCNGLTISGNTISDNAAGITVAAASATQQLRDVSICGNAIFNTPGGPMNQNSGIYVAGPMKSVSICGNTIERIVSNPGYGGIYIVAGGGTDGNQNDGVTISGNTIRDCLYCVFLESTTAPLRNCMISGNTMTWNAGEVTLQSSGAVRINAAVDNLSISSNSIRVRGWSGASPAAIWVAGNGSLSISGNTISLDASVSSIEGVVLANHYGACNISISNNTVRLINGTNGVFYGGIQVTDTQFPSLLHIIGNAFQGFTPTSAYAIYLSDSFQKWTYTVVSNVTDGGSLRFSPDPVVAAPVNAPFSRSSSTHFFDSSLVMNGQNLANGSTQPSAGGNQGDIVFNKNAASGSYVGWVCVSPGIWRPFGAIA